MVWRWVLALVVCGWCGVVACGDDAKETDDKVTSGSSGDVGVEDTIGEDAPVEGDTSEEDVAQDTDPSGVCEVMWVNTQSAGEPSEIFAYEASRPDATADQQGEKSNSVCSRPGVQPWTNVSYDEAIEACERIGAQLCEPLQWDDGCRGPERSTYPYGDTYDGEACGTIDSSLGGCLSGSCSAAPTGAYDGCRSSVGAFDMSGNVAEWILDQRPFGEEVFSVRGGSYQSANDNSIRCRNPNVYQPRDTRTEYLGFRCCRQAR